MTLIIATKTISAVYGTMALQLIEAFQCSVTYSMKQTIAFLDYCNTFIDFIVCNCSFKWSFVGENFVFVLIFRKKFINETTEQ